MNLYELYADNIDKIEEKTTVISNIFISNIYENIIEKINKLQPEYLKNGSQLIEKREELFEIVNHIDKKYYNNEITEINNYIDEKYFKELNIKSRNYEEILKHKNNQKKIF